MVYVSYVVLTKMDTPHKYTLTTASVVRALWHAKTASSWNLKVRTFPVFRQTSLEVLTPSVNGLVCSDKGQSSCLEILVSSFRIWLSLSNEYGLPYTFCSCDDSLNHDVTINLTQRYELARKTRVLEFCAHSLQFKVT